MEIERAILAVIVFGLSAVIHEYAHAWMGNRLGDPTAKSLGRMTLNPLAHIDPFGTVILPVIMFYLMGWIFAYAKPVPYNPLLLKDQRWDPVKIALSGPASNFLLAIPLGLLFRAFPQSSVGLLLNSFVYANVILGVFNLIPIPPLDGSKLLFALLPPSMEQLRLTLERYGFVILLAFVFIIGFYFIFPLMRGLHWIITGGAPIPF
jgi:Zn-dependent protease